MSHSNLPEDLIEKLEHRLVIPFVGAGISMSVLKKQDKQTESREWYNLYPGWGELLRRAADKANKSVGDALREMMDQGSFDYTEAAQMALKGFNKNKWYEFIQENLNPPYEVVDEDSLELASLIWKLGSNLVITTNYDRVLAWANGPGLHDASRWVVENKSAQVDYRKKKTRQPRTNEVIFQRPTIWHLHGFVDEIESIILDPSGYAELYLDNDAKAATEPKYQGALDFLAEMIRIETLLFLGFSFEDAYFVNFFKQQTVKFSGFIGPHYVVVAKHERDKIQKTLDESGLSDLVELIAIDGFGPPMIELLKTMARVVHPDEFSQPITRDAGIPNPTGTGEAILGPGTEFGSREVARPKALKAGDVLGEYIVEKVVVDEPRRQHLIAFSRSAPRREVWIELDAHEDPGSMIAELQRKKEALLFGSLGNKVETPEHMEILNRNLMRVFPARSGRNLRQFRNTGDWSPVLEMTLLVEVAEILQSCHELGIYHLNLAPEQILLEEDQTRVRTLVGFQLSLPSSTEARRTRSRITPYSSPEQCDSSWEPDGRADIWALGIMLYEIWNGKPPFLDSDAALQTRIRQQPVSYREDCPAEVWALLVKALEKDPGQRFNFIDEMVVAMKEALQILATGNGTQPPGEAVHDVDKGDDELFLIGRERELAELKAHAGIVLQGECHLILLRGHAGMGKHGLLEALARTAAGKRFKVLRGRFWFEDNFYPYKVFTDLVIQFFNDMNNRPLIDMSDLAAELQFFFRDLEDVPALSRHGKGQPGEEIREQKNANPEYLFDLMRMTLSRMAEAAPLLLILENLEKARPALRALTYLFGTLADVPILAVGTYNDPPDSPLEGSLLKELEDNRRFDEITSRPLSLRDTTRFIAHFRKVPILEVTHEERNHIHHMTRGVPFLIREYLRSPNAEAFRGDQRPPRHSIAARWYLDLEEGERRILDVAALLGHDLTHSDLAALSGVEAANVQQYLEALTEDGFIETDGDSYTLANEMISEQVAAVLSREEQKRIHREYAEILSRGPGANPQSLTYHYLKADEPARAMASALDTARKALRSLEIRAMKQTLDLVADFVEDPACSQEHRSHFHALRAREYRATNKHAETLDAAWRAQAGLEGRDLAELIELAVETARLQGNMEQLQQWYELGLQRVDAGKFPQRRRMLLTAAATTAMLQGKHSQADAWFKEAEELRRATRDKHQREETGGTLEVALHLPDPKLIPGSIHAYEEYEIVGNVLETLVSVDENGFLVPLLCQSYSHDETFREWTFYLGNQRRFSDGSPIGAAEVKAALEATRASAPGPSVPVLDQIQSIEAGKGVVKIRLEDTLAIFPALLADRGIAAIWKPNPAKPELPIGSGPFVLEGFSLTDNGKLVTLRRNTEHPNPPALDKLVFHLEKVDEDALTNLVTGEIHVAPVLSPRNEEELLRRSSFTGRLVTSIRHETAFLLLSDDLPNQLRYHMLSCLDVKALVSRRLGRLAQPAQGLIPPGIPGHGQEGDWSPRRPDDTFSDGQPNKIRALVHPIFMTGDGPQIKETHARVWQDIKKIWSEQLDITIDEVPAEDFRQCQNQMAARGDKQGIQIVLSRWSSDYPDPDGFTHALFNGRNGLYRAIFRDAALDGLLQKARSHTDRDRLEAYALFERALAQRNILLPLYHGMDHRLISSEVDHAHLSAREPFLNYNELMLQRAGAGGTDRNREPLTIPVSTQLTSLDPLQLDRYENAEILPNIYETLTSIDDKARIQPRLASFKLEQAVVDGKAVYRVRFILKRGVRFYNGPLLTSLDVKWTIERLIKTRGRHQTYLDCIRGARELRDPNSDVRELGGLIIHSDQSFTIELVEKIAFLPAMMMHPALGIIPHGTDFSGSVPPPGTGPYRLVKPHNPKGLIRRLDLVFNHQYHCKHLPKSERLTFMLAQSHEETHRQLELGRYALMRCLDSEEALPESKIESELSTYFMCVNPKGNNQLDAELRQPLAKLFRLSMKQVARAYSVVPALGIIPPELLNRKPGQSEDQLTGLETRPKRQITLKVLVNEALNNHYPRIWAEIRRVLAEMGIQLEIQKGLIDPEGTAHHQVDLIFYRWIADYPDANAFVKWFHTNDPWFGWLVEAEDPDAAREVDRLIENARSMSDPTYRRALYTRLQDILVRQKALVIPLFHGMTHTRGTPGVKWESRFGFPTIDYRTLVKE